MKTNAIWVAVALPGAMLAADWLTDGGNPSRDSWQSREKGLSTENVHGLKLLWKRDLGEASLTAPVILGPIFTHRGIKELVFVEGASSTVYSVDADLGRIFWARKLEAGAACAGMPVTPLIAPEELEKRSPARPIYFLGGDGAMHKVLPATGEDMQPAVGGCGKHFEIAPFVQAGTAKFSWQGRDVVLTGAVATWTDGRSRWIYTATAEGLRGSLYGGAQVWTAHGLGAPVIANGMVFALSTAGTVQLNVLDAKTGSFLYSSGEALGQARQPSGIALANGHVCFTNAGSLYCFGLPLEI
jgi:outer membrane protein assembly factor BamB